MPDLLLLSGPMESPGCCEIIKSVLTSVQWHAGVRSFHQVFQQGVCMLLLVHENDDWAPLLEVTQKLQQLQEFIFLFDHQLHEQRQKRRGEAYEDDGPLNHPWGRNEVLILYHMLFHVRANHAASPHLDLNRLIQNSTSKCLHGSGEGGWEHDCLTIRTDTVHNTHHLGREIMLS